MKHLNKHKGFSLIEILVVIAIMAILATVSIMVGATLQTKARIKNTETAIGVLVDALQQYKLDRDKRNGQFAFPPDPMMVEIENGTPSGSWDAVKQCFYDTYNSNSSILIINGVYPEKMILYFDSSNSDTFQGKHNSMTWEDGIVDKYPWALGSIEVLYAYLSNVPECVDVLNKLPSKQTANDDNDSLAFDFGGSIQAKPLIEVNDGWGAPLRYRNMGRGNFPVIDSAGPDGQFETADDIVSGEL